MSTSHQIIKQQEVCNNFNHGDLNWKHTRWVFLDTTMKDSDILLSVLYPPFRLRDTYVN